ncbi:hypothetical protein GCM10009839_44910 [Catenulispora yoronensis]|uniref:Hsp70 protein n=1 Tax=Catenulispora yoronensis TaxID=450799 RepID=A0ABP5G5R2_9ACTN
MAIVYGVDVGTTTSVLAVGRTDGSDSCVVDRGSPGLPAAVPTAVFISEDGAAPLVGGAALKAGARDPVRLFTEFKREFGDRAPRDLDGRPVQPHRLTAEVLEFLRCEAESQSPGTPDLVVVTHPASWEQGNRELLAEAVRAAGFDPDRVRLLPEPVAAAQYAAGARSGETILVFDLGGGTFDCALAGPTASGDVEVLGLPGGLPDVGGGDFDRRILRRLHQDFPELAAKVLDGPSPGDPEALRRRNRLKDACERLKIQLSVAEVDEIELTDTDPPSWFKLTRAELADLVADPLADALAECDRLLTGLGWQWQQVDCVVPVGGSCRLPLVRELLASRTGRPLLPVPEPELAVAYGAVRYGRGLLQDRHRRGHEPEKSPFED